MKLIDSILVNAILLAAVVYGLVTQRRWLWIAATAVLVSLLVSFLLWGGAGTAQQG